MVPATPAACAAYPNGTAACAGLHATRLLASYACSRRASRLLFSGAASVMWGIDILLCCFIPAAGTLSPAGSLNLSIENARSTRHGRRIRRHLSGTDIGTCPFDVHPLSQPQPLSRQIAHRVAESRWRTVYVGKKMIARPRRTRIRARAGTKWHFTHSRGAHFSACYSKDRALARSKRESSRPAHGFAGSCPSDRGQTRARVLRHLKKPLASQQMRGRVDSLRQTSARCGGRRIDRSAGFMVWHAPFFSGPDSFSFCGKRHKTRNGSVNATRRLQASATRAQELMTACRDDVALR